MPDWLTVVLGVLSLLLGTGGGTAYYKARKDAKLGIRQQETAEDAAWDERWKGIIKAQTESLLQPLQAQVDRQGAKIAQLETELGSLRTRYWRSIHHIRDLLAWIAKHLPDADPPPPVTPADIAEDL